MNPELGVPLRSRIRGDIESEVCEGPYSTVLLPVAFKDLNMYIYT